MSVAKKPRILHETSREKLDDARILFLWKIKEAAKTFRITIFTVFANSCGDSNFKTFSNAVEDLSTQYLNDVTSLYDAFSIDISFPDADRTTGSEYISHDTSVNTSYAQRTISTEEIDIEAESENPNISIETKDKAEPETSDTTSETKNEHPPETSVIFIETKEEPLPESSVTFSETKEPLLETTVTYSETKEEAELDTISESKQETVPETLITFSEVNEEDEPETPNIINKTKVEAVPETSNTTTFEAKADSDTSYTNKEIPREKIEEFEPETSNTTSEAKDAAVPETLDVTSEPTIFHKDGPDEVQEQAVSYIIDDAAASNEYIQNIEFEDGDYGGESVMYLTLASDDPGVVEYKDGTGAVIRYIQTQDELGNTIYTQADEANVPSAENAQIAADADGNVQQVEYIHVSDTTGNVAYAAGDEPMVIEYAAEASASSNVIEYADALNAGAHYATEVESLPKEISDIQNFDVTTIKQEVGSVPMAYSDSLHLPTTVTSSALVAPKQEPGIKNRTGPPKKKFNPLQRSLLDQLDIKDVVCTVADESEDGKLEEKDLAKAQLLGETENVADLEFTIAPKFPNVRKRKALEPGETKGFSCDLCGDLLYTQNALTKHKNRMHPEQSEYICCLCYKFCSNKKDLRSHFYNAHNKDELCTCPVCGFSYTTHGDFKDHLKACTFTPEDLGYKKPVFEKKPVKGAHLPFKCKFCSMGFVRKGTLTHHIVVKHLKYTKGSSNSCEVCEKRFLHEYSLIKHYRTKDHIRKVKETYGSQSDEEEEEVNQLAHGFTNIAGAPVVKKRGTREQSSLFICYMCGKDFNRESSLNIHLAKHMKAYECEVCGHRLDSRAQLVIHRRIHTGDTPFVCDLCGKGLRSNKHLYQHKKQMHSDVAYKCAHCGSVFKQLSSLYQHIRKKHGEQAYEDFKKKGARNKLVPLVQSGINH